MEDHQIINEEGNHQEESEEENPEEEYIFEDDPAKEEAVPPVRRNHEVIVISDDDEEEVAPNQGIGDNDDVHELIVISDTSVIIQVISSLEEQAEGDPDQLEVTSCYTEAESED